MRIPRVAAIAAALAAVATAAAAGTLLAGGPATAQQGDPSQQLMLGVGDTMRVEGTDLGCQVSRRAGRTTVECRRVRETRASYGTFLDARRAIVARFRSPDTARTIFTARHGGGYTVCRSSRAIAATTEPPCR